MIGRQINSWSEAVTGPYCRARRWESTLTVLGVQMMLARSVPTWQARAVSGLPTHTQKGKRGTEVEGGVSRRLEIVLFNKVMQRQPSWRIAYSTSAGSRIRSLGWSRQVNRRLSRALRQAISSPRCTRQTDITLLSAVRARHMAFLISSRFRPAALAYVWTNGPSRGGITTSCETSSALSCGNANHDHDYKQHADCQPILHPPDI